MENSNKSISQFQERMGDQVMASPQPFLNAFQYLIAGDLNQASVSFAQAIPVIDKVWQGVANCCLAYILKSHGLYQDAISFAKRGKELELNLVGYWYYYDSLIESLDCTDNLLDALVIVEEAIHFYKQENAPLNLADCLVSKIGILKQLAYALSTDPMETVYAYRMKNVPPEIEDMLRRRAFILKQMEHLLSKEQNHFVLAKNFILEAIRAICEGLSIQDFQLSEKHKEQFSAIASIAARVGVRVKDVSFIDNFGNIKTILESYFGARVLNRKAASEYHNMAISAREKGDKQAAIQYFKEALDICDEETPAIRGYKALIAYEYGVCLWYMHGLKDYRGYGELSKSAANAIKQIRELWNKCLSLYSTLDEKSISSMDKTYASRLIGGVQNIRRDPIMMWK